MSMPSALDAAIAADTDHVVCVAADGHEHSWQELLGAAARVRAHVEAAEGRRFALDLEHGFKFAAALLGCWAAGKTPVLAPRQMLANRDPAVVLHGGITDDAAAAPQRGWVRWSNLGTSNAPVRAIDGAAQIVLYTSGSTGDPKEVRRAVHNLEAELAVLESLWGPEIGSARHCTTVSHRHVYGLLFGVLWPLLGRRAFSTFALEFPEQLAGSAGERVLVSSPALLKRLAHLPPGTGEWAAVFSSGGLLSNEASVDAARVLGSRPIEVLGSTETSGVAWRRQLPHVQGAFELLPRVEARPNADGTLAVRSPFSGHAGWLSMGDRVRFVGERAFELLERADHIAKIEDKRVSLAEVERYLVESPLIEEAAAVALEEGGRQYVGAVVRVSSLGAIELARDGRRSFTQALRASLREKLEPIAVPRKVRYVESIPVDPQGKRRQPALRELFQARR